MKILVVGGGSIGSRHLRNLRSLGIEHLAVVEPNRDRRKLFSENVIGFEDLDTGLDWHPEAVIIATPSYLHVSQALAAAKSCHLFIEKPLSHSIDGLPALMKITEEKEVISLIGCNMRFHPGPARVKQLLDDETVGKVLFARVYTGSYLPKWHPHEDYRQSYSAKAELGGGCILDCVHEVDLTRWYLGDAEEIYCAAGHLSSLEINVEDVAVLICKHHGGVLSEIHLDYVQQTYERGCQIVGEKGTISWDFTDNNVKFFDNGRQKWQTYPMPEKYDLNQMYIDEMSHFLDCIKAQKESLFPIPEAVKVMKMVFAAKESIKTNTVIKLKGKTQ